jgi:hypothetical protein
MLNLNVFALCKIFAACVVNVKFTKTGYDYNLLAPKKSVRITYLANKNVRQLFILFNSFICGTNNSLLYNQKRYHFKIVPILKYQKLDNRLSLIH